VPWGGMRRVRRPLPLPRRHYIALPRSKKNVAASGCRLRQPGLVHRGKSPHGESQQAVLGQWPLPRPARSSTQPPVKDHSNDNPFRLAGVWGCRTPRVGACPRQPCQARACPCCTRSACDRRPPTGRTAHPHGGAVDAGTPRCGRVRRRGARERSERNVCAATPARVQGPVCSRSHQPYGGEPP
jgi:hypothetical protein